MRFFKRAAIVTAMIGIFAPAAMALSATQTVQKEIITFDENGAEQVRYESAELVTPGERIAYSIDYINDRAEPAANLELMMPVPGVVSYAEGSARGNGTLITYSVDGTNFVDRSALRVDDRPALAEDITHIKWVITGPVNPGEVGSLAFSGTLK